MLKKLPEEKLLDAVIQQLVANSKYATNGEEIAPHTNLWKVQRLCISYNWHKQL